MKKPIQPKEERTFLLVKPDGVKRGLVGECVTRIEQRGLKLIAMKMIFPSAQRARGHYPGTEGWLRGMGEKTLESYAKYGKDPVKELGTGDALKIGKMIYGWNTDFLTSGPVVAMVVSGIHAVDMVRKIVGKTIPSFAEMGTISGDFSVDSPALANANKRAVHNLIHASGNPAESKNELRLWFKKNRLHSYKRTEDDVMF